VTALQVPIGALLVLACSVSAYAGEALRIVEFADLQRHASFAMGAAREWQRDEQVSFTLEGGVVQDKDRIGLTGWIRNTAAEPRLVVIFPVGNTGFIIQPAPGTVKKRLGPPIPPSAPPPPLAVTLPANSHVRLEAALYLADWEWNPDVPRAIEWSYQFWTEPKPRGRLAIP